jgi:hypothetical protein
VKLLIVTHLKEPVIAFDMDTIFSFDGNTNFVNSYNIFSNESKLVSLDHFLSTYSFKEAMEGLLSVILLQTNIKREFQRLIDQAESELSEISNEL